MRTRNNNAQHNNTKQQRVVVESLLPSIQARPSSLVPLWTLLRTNLVQTTLFKEQKKLKLVGAHFESISTSIHHDVEAFLDSLLQEDRQPRFIRRERIRITNLMMDNFDLMPSPVLSKLTSRQKQSLLQLFFQVNNEILDAHMAWANFCFSKLDEVFGDNSEGELPRAIMDRSLFDGHIAVVHIWLCSMRRQYHVKTVRAGPSGSSSSLETNNARQLIPFWLQRLNSFSGRLARGMIFDLAALPTFEFTNDINVVVEYCLLPTVASFAPIGNVKLVAPGFEYREPRSNRLVVYSWDDISDRQKMILWLADILELSGTSSRDPGVKIPSPFFRLASKGRPRLDRDDHLSQILLAISSELDFDDVVRVVTALENTYYRCNSDQKGRMEKRGCGISLKTVHDSVGSVHGVYYHIVVKYCPVPPPRFSVTGEKVVPQFAEAKSKDWDDV
ncbi:unnamed protein product [Cylindrotheca closterium]|uniref:Uncharacterized protein n=1 Tax=Cylindrotheca closterium TaxID=2856 RepID=A0AAD2JJ83_9STRA|nr:unnamed protein product [Cylindrotheca closterium]